MKESRGKSRDVQLLGLCYYVPEEVLSASKGVISSFQGIFKDLD